MNKIYRFGIVDVEAKKDEKKVVYESAGINRRRVLNHTKQMLEFLEGRKLKIIELKEIA